MAASIARKRIAGLGAALAVACVLAGCGSSPPASVTAGPPSDGRYVGETSQGLPISFTVAGTTIRDVSFGWRARCDDGQVHSNMIALPGGRLNDRAFSTGGPLETGGLAHVTGTIEGAQASGVLSRSRGSAFGTDCRAAGIAWSAGRVAEGGPDELSPPPPAPGADGIAA
jgi:hypothetical protein